MINDLDGANVGIHELEALADALCDPARTAHAEATLSKLVAAGGACSPLLDLLMDRLDGKGREYHIGTGARRAMARLLEEAARLRGEQLAPLLPRMVALTARALGDDVALKADLAIDDRAFDGRTTLIGRGLSVALPRLWRGVNISD